MILQCPKCKKRELLQIERRPNGDITCMNCNTKGKHADFNFRTQHLEKIFFEIQQLAEKDLRIGQIFLIIQEHLKADGQMLFYVENDVILEKLKELT